LHAAAAVSLRIFNMWGDVFASPIIEQKEEILRPQGFGVGSICFLTAPVIRTNVDN